VPHTTHARLDVVQDVTFVRVGLQPCPAGRELARVEVDVVHFTTRGEVGDVVVVDFVVGVGLFTCEHKITFD